MIQTGEKRERELTRNYMSEHHSRASEMTREDSGESALEEGQIGCDTWFYSVSSCEKLKKHFGLNSMLAV